MPRDSARITRQGIVFKGMSYVCDRALREQWFVRAGLRGRSSLEASFDPRYLGRIYLHLHNEPVEICHLLEKYSHFASCSEEEIVDLQYKLSNAKDVHEDIKIQGQADCDAQVNAVLAEAARMKQSTPTSKSNNQRIQGIKDNRREERNQRRDEDAWKLGAEAEPHNPAESVPPPLDQLSEPESVLSKEETLLNILQQQRSKKAKGAS
jgi:hypothetical protein